MQIQSAYAFEGGYPSPATIVQAHEDSFLERAIEAYRFFYPTVSFQCAVDGMRAVGARDNRVAVVLACGPRHRLFTGNSDAPYLQLTLDLEAGPMVVEVPTGSLMGIFNAHNFRWIGDVGIAGPDGGRGGKHLVLPPNHCGPIPEDHHAWPSPTYTVMLALRALPVHGDLEAAMALLTQIKVYPLTDVAPHTPLTILDLSTQALDATPLELETTLGFWETLRDVLDDEPAFAEYHAMYGMLASIGIEHDKAFLPDARTQEMLSRAAHLGRAQMLVAAFASDRPDRLAWPDRHWEWASLRYENGDFELPSGLDLEARDRWFAQAVGASPKMFLRSPGAGSLYWLGARDRDGTFLDGSRTYKLVVPTPVPSQTSWSVTVYDAETRSQIQNSREQAALRSAFELDGLRDSPLELYFGPDAPLGKERQWIETLPRRGWFAYLRIYGPTGAAFDGSWKPGDFEPIG